MRIGLNATCFSSDPSGANQRFRLLYGAVIERNPQITFVIFEPRDFAVSSWFAKCSNVEVVQTPLLSRGRIARFFSGIGFWHRALKAAKLDLFECFHLPVVIAPDCPTLVTIHDLRPVRSDARWIERLLAKPVFHHALSRVAGTSTVSQSVAHELSTLNPSAPVHVVHNGSIAKPAGKDDEWDRSASLSELALPEQFMLTVGPIEPRKNQGQLVRAVAYLKREGVLRPLVIAGNDGGAGASLNALISQLDVAGLVTVVSGLSDSEIAELYQRCKLFAFPSSYEGFGIPLLEAMAAQKPILASDIPVFREVAGSAAAYFPLHDVPATAQAIESLWSDPARRVRLIEEGNKRIASFDFNRLADQLAAIYSNVLAKPASKAAAE
jgi:glycosyltransferase involved in cell wall biosynthesis